MKMSGVENGDTGTINNNSWTMIIVVVMKCTDKVNWLSRVISVIYHIHLYFIHKVGRVVQGGY